MLSSLEEAPVNSTPSKLLADTNVATETLSGAHDGSPSPVHEPSSDAGDLNCDARSQVQSSLLHSCSGWSHTISPPPLNLLQYAGSFKFLEGQTAVRGK